MKKQNIIEELIGIAGADCVAWDVPLKDHTSFRVGGPADIMVCPENVEILAETIKACEANHWDYFLMGNGSNLLFRDGGYRGIIIKTRTLDGVTVEGQRVLAEAGASLRRVAEAAMTHGLTGMEFASGIPGSMGGALVMNAGAYDGEMKDIVKWVEILNPKGERVVLSPEECDFSYRHSSIQDNPWIVTRVALQLKEGDQDAIKEKMADLNGRRRDKQPLEYPSAGSTFRRPVGYFAGKLVQDCGFKGYRIGGAQVSEKHSGFVINRDNATAEDIITLIETIQKKVKADYGVDLQTEVIMMGE